jgi:polar amino acid transport system substrate-binding protein
VPSDPDGTLERVEGATMRVGVTEADPWVVLEGERPRGLEVGLVRSFARSLGARVEWVEGSEAELVAALHEGQLDLVAGGLTPDGPWETEVALTRPYATSRIVVGFPAGAPVPEDLEGQRVRVERGSEAAGLLRDEGALPVPVADLTGTGRGAPAAAETWTLGRLGLRPSSFELRSSEHVMAVPLGENAWLVRLERFLLEREGEVSRALERAGRP